MQALGTLDTIVSKWYMISDLDNYMSTILMKNTGYGRYNTYYQKRVLWTLKRAPDFQEAAPTIVDSYISIPMIS